MASGVTHLSQIFVLPAGPNTLLAGHRKLVGPELQALEDALELYHPGVGEQQGGVVRRDQGGARHLRVAPRLEELQELAADFGGGHGGDIVAPPTSSPSSFTPPPPHPPPPPEASKPPLPTGPGGAASRPGRLAPPPQRPP